MKTEEQHWPRELDISDSVTAEEINTEIKRKSLAVAAQTTVAVNPVIKAENISSFEKLVRVTAWTLRATTKMRKLEQRFDKESATVELQVRHYENTTTFNINTLSAEDLRIAETAVIRQLQREAFPELFQLQPKPGDKKKLKGHKLEHLRPF